MTRTSDEDHHWRRYCYHHRHHCCLNREGDTPLILSHTTLPIAPVSVTLRSCVFQSAQFGRRVVLYLCLQS